MAARLPVCPRPIAGEALPSWLARVGRVYGLSSNDLAEAIRILPEPGAPLDQSNLRRLARLSRVPEPQLLRLLSGPADWTLAEGRAMSVCLACFDRDLERGERPHLRNIWCQSWRVICPQHGTRLDSVPSGAALPPPGRRLTRARVHALSRLGTAARAAVPDPDTLPEAAVFGAVRAAETGVTDALCGVRPDPVIWSVLAPRDFLRVASDITRWALSNFAPAAAHAPAADTPRAVKAAAALLFRRSSRPLPAFGVSGGGVRSLTDVAHPGTRAAALWWLYALTADAAPATQFLRDPRRRQRALLEGRSPDGLQWLASRLGSWPAHYVEDRWVNVAELADPGYVWPQRLEN